MDSYFEGTYSQIVGDIEVQRFELEAKFKIFDVDGGFEDVGEISVEIVK